MQQQVRQVSVGGLGGSGNEIRMFNNQVRISNQFEDDFGKPGP